MRTAAWLRSAVASGLTCDRSPAGHVARCGLSLEEWQRRRDAGLARCYGCTKWKPQGDFARDKSRPTGFTSICKPCVGLRVAVCRYGISLEAMAALPGADGACPLCERVGQKMHIDHCHDTEKVRGFLCSRCNVGLGQFEDSVALLLRAVAYLEKHNA
jgi:hypothetical protein